MKRPPRTKKKINTGLFKDPNLRKYAEYLSYGTEIALTIAVPILAGYWIDQVFETTPVYTLGGVLLGIVLMIASFSRIIRKLNKRD